MDSQKLLNQAVNFHRNGELKDAIELYKKILKEKPNAYAAANNLALIYNFQKKYLESFTLLKNILKAQPNNLRAITNYANSLTGLNRYDEAIYNYKKALNLKPEFVDAIGNLANCQVMLNQFVDAFNNFQKVFKIDPNNIEARINYGLLQLRHGNFKEGWKNYEWRKKKMINRNQHIKKQDQEWFGKDILKDKTIFVYHEQGLGDHIQYCRYLPLIKRMGAKIILDTPKQLKNMIASMDIDYTHIDDLKKIQFDYYCSIVSLPFAFNTTIDTIPNKIPYLFTPKDKKIFWKEKLKNNNTKIGLKWSGNSKYQNDKNRSTSLEKFKPLFELPYEFHSLHIEYSEEDKVIMKDISNLFCHKDEILGLDNTAGLIDAMDLVISVDTGIVQLTGALGKTFWNLLPFSSDQRWLLNRSDSPWFPTAKLYRQSKIDDWDAVIQNIKKDLLLIKK